MMKTSSANKTGHVVSKYSLEALANRIADLEAQLAESQRHKELLRAVVENHVTIFDQIANWRIGIMGEIGEVYSGSVSRKRIDDMYLEAVAAIDGGAIEIK